jgi:hypothetical protein
MQQRVQSSLVEPKSARIEQRPYNVAFQDIFPFSYGTPQRYLYSTWRTQVRSTRLFLRLTVRICRTSQDRPQTIPTFLGAIDPETNLIECVLKIQRFDARVILVENDTVY